MFFLSGISNHRGLAHVRSPPNGTYGCLLLRGSEQFIIPSSPHSKHFCEAGRPDRALRELLLRQQGPTQGHPVIGGVRNQTLFSLFQSTALNKFGETEKHHWNLMTFFSPGHFIVTQLKKLQKKR